MNINGTLLIQACNFFGAYLILRFLYCKPAAHALQKEYALKADLHVSISTLQASIAAKQYEQKKQARGYQVYYEQNTPDAVHSRFDVITDIRVPLPIETVDAAHIEQLQNDLVHELRKKVGINA